MKQIVKFLIIISLIFVSESCISSAIPSVPKEDDSVFEELTYVAFGDSITFGADYTRNYSQMDNPYPKLVAEELSLLSYKNLAISGAVFCKNDLNLVCMTDVILSYTDETDIISIMLGVNDWARSLPLGSIEDNTTSTVYGCLNLIATHLTTTHEHAFSFFMTPYKTTLVRNEDYVLLDVVNAIKQVAFAYNIPVLDMYNLGKYELEMYNSDSDGIHPSEKFFENYTAPMIVEFIKENYK